MSVLLGNGNGTFQSKADYATTPSTKSVTIADINGDGKLDVLAASINGNYPDLVNPGGDKVAVFIGNGNGTLQPRVDFTVGQGAFGVTVGNLNGDNKPDMVVSNWHDNNVMVRLNTSS